MKDIHVLYGFSSEEIASGIEKSLKAIGYRIISTMRPTKQMLKEYAEEHREIEVVILKEYMDGGDSYSINELVELADNVSSKCKFIVVLSPGYKGRDSMRELYNAGVLEAVFSDGRKGVDPDKIAELAVYGRTRREAREYYKIQRKLVKKQHLTYLEFKEAVDFLGNEKAGINLMERFEHVTRWMTSEQLARLIETMPVSILEPLKQYREYYDIHNQLYRQGLLGSRMRCPRDAVDGLDAKEYAKGVAKMNLREPDEEIFIAPVQTKTASSMEKADNSDVMDGFDDSFGAPFGAPREESSVHVGEITSGSMGSNLGEYMAQQRRAEEEKVYADLGIAFQTEPLYEPVGESAPEPQSETVPAEGPSDYTDMDVDSLIAMLG